METCQATTVAPTQPDARVVSVPSGVFVDSATDEGTHDELSRGSKSSVHEMSAW